MDMIKTATTVALLITLFQANATEKPPETPTKSPEAAHSALDNRLVRVAELARGLSGATFNCPSPPICPAGRKCCEPDDNGGCRLCVPKNASCP